MRTSIHTKLREPQSDAPTHAIRLGEKVFLQSTLASADDRLFEVIRWLPDQGAGPQYRIQSAKTGQERVVTAAEISQL